MANKHPGQPRMHHRVEALIRAGLPNDQVLAEVAKEFPELHTAPEQIRFFRHRLRARDNSIPTSVEARRLSAVRRGAASQ
jgi:hypothetical protein